MALAAWQARIEAARSSISSIRDPGALLEACLEYEALAVGFAQYRDMYFIGRMGAELGSRYSATGKLPGTASFLVGRLHENIGTILRGFGVRVNERGNATDAHERQEIDCVRRGRITPADTEALMNSLADW